MVLIISVIIIRYLINQLDQKVFRSILSSCPPVFQYISKYLDIDKKEEREDFYKNFGKY